MTTEPPGPIRWLRTAAIALPLLFLGWIGTMAAVMLISDAAPAAVAILPHGDFVGRLPEDAAILSLGRFHVTVESETPHFGPALYRAGALLVLPAGLTGCLPLPG